MSYFVDEPKKTEKKIRRMKQFIKIILIFDRIFLLFYVSFDKIIFSTNFWKYVGSVITLKICVQNFRGIDE